MDFNEDLKKTPSKKMTSSPRPFTRIFGTALATRGAHQFRHGLSTEMMRQGASLSEIGDVLGHRHPDTTRIYARVNLEALRPLALPWPGGVR